jgi:hypothetical protein
MFLLESDDLTLLIVSASEGKSASISVFCSVHADKIIVQVCAIGEQWRCGETNEWRPNLKITGGYGLQESIFFIYR